MPDFFPSKEKNPLFFSSTFSLPTRRGGERKGCFEPAASRALLSCFHPSRMRCQQVLLATAERSAVALASAT